MESPEITNTASSKLPSSGDGRASVIECPRDAMQGWPSFIPTEKKIAYLNQLIKVGFHTLDCGSFVSAKAIPQMADTAEVIAQLNTLDVVTKLLVIVANERGAAQAVQFENITYLGYPFSISPTFQQRNANSSIKESFERVKAIQHVCVANNKQLVVYLSMAFGNPYGDDYSEDILLQWANKLHGIGVNIISLADTVGLASPEQVGKLTSATIAALPTIEIGVHLHSTIVNWHAKMDAAFNAGCRRFDGALKGIGGCPMANDELVGNMDTELMIAYLEQKQLLPALNHDALLKASEMAAEIFHLT